MRACSRCGAWHGRAEGRGHSSQAEQQQVFRLKFLELQLFKGVEVFERPGELVFSTLQQQRVREAARR